MSLEGGEGRGGDVRGGEGEGRGGEGRGGREGGEGGREGRRREGGRREGREGRNDCYTHIILMAAQYLYNNGRRVLRNNVSQHSIGSTPHNNGTYYVRLDVDTLS